MATTDKIRSKLVNNRYTMDRRRPTWTKARKGRKWNDAHEDYEVRVHSMHLRRLLCTNGGKRSIGQRDRKTKMLQSNWLSPVNAQPQQPRPCYLIWPPYFPLHHRICPPPPYITHHHRIFPTTTGYSPPNPSLFLRLPHSPSPSLNESGCLSACASVTITRSTLGHRLSNWRSIRVYSRAVWFGDDMLMK